MYIQELVQKRLDDAGINNYQLSKQTGISYSSVRDFLRPNNRIDLVKLDKVCKVIKITAWQLVQELKRVNK